MLLEREDLLARILAFFKWLLVKDSADTLLVLVIACGCCCREDNRTFKSVCWLLISTFSWMFCFFESSASPACISGSKRFILSNLLEDMIDFRIRFVTELMSILGLVSLIPFSRATRSFVVTLVLLGFPVELVSVLVLSSVGLFKSI